MKKTLLIVETSVVALLCAHFIFVILTQSPKYFTKWYFKPYIVTGKIIDLPKLKPHHVQFILKTNHGKILLNDYNPSHKPYIPGAIWQLMVKLKPLHGLINPFGFNYKTYLEHQNIVATGYIKQSVNNKLITFSPWNNPINFWRYKIRQHLLTLIQTYKQNAAAPILPALAIGDRSSLNPSTYQIFQNTGTAHLIAISGLHVGLIFTITFFLIRWLISFIPWLIKRHPAQKIATCAAFIIAVGYSALAGFSTPTYRALIMLAVIAFGILFNKRFSPIKALIIAALLIMLLTPKSMLTVSAGLSFSAVFFLIYTLANRPNINKKTSLLLPQCKIFLCLIPLCILWFGQFSIVAIPANLVAIPITSLLIVPLIFGGLIFIPINNQISILFNKGAILALSLLLKYLTMLAELPCATMHLAHPTYITLIFAIFGILLITAPAAIKCRMLGVIFLLPLFFNQPQPPSINRVKLTMLDVGQGLSCIIQTHSHLLVYDAGPAEHDGFNAGKSVVLPYLYGIGVHKIDKLVISHGDNDHIGGAPAILQNIKTKSIATSALQKLAYFHPKFCHPYESWQWDGVNFMFLDNGAKTPGDDNNHSCILRISTNNKSILLTGDMEKPVEEYLIKHEKQFLATTILVAPHHGSISSSTMPFVRATHPKDVLFATGFHNRFGFPNPKVVSRYKTIGAKIYNTGTMGFFSKII